MSLGRDDGSRDRGASLTAAIPGNKDLRPIGYEITVLVEQFYDSLESETSWKENWRRKSVGRDIEMINSSLSQRRRAR